MNEKLTLRDFVKRFDNPYSASLLILLLCADIIFAVLSLIGMLTPYLDSYLYSILMDGSYAEVYQYIKWFWILILLVFMSKERRSLGYLALGAVYLYILLDDSLLIHERFGMMIKNNFVFNAPFSLDPQDCGEFIASAISGMILGPLVLLAYIRGNKYFRMLILDLLLLFCMLIFFGFFVDIGKHLFNLGTKVGLMISFIEDSGEMVMGSIILWYLFLISGPEQADRPFLVDYIRILLKRKR